MNDSWQAAHVSGAEQSQRDDRDDAMHRTYAGRDDGLYHQGGLAVPRADADWLRAAIARADAVRAAWEAGAPA